MQSLWVRVSRGWVWVLKEHRINNHYSILVRLATEDVELGQFPASAHRKARVDRVTGGQRRPVYVRQVISSEVQRVWLSGLRRKDPVRVIFAHENVLLDVPTERGVQVDLVKV